MRLLGTASGVCFDTSINHTTAPKMTAPPISVATPGVSPGQIHTHSGANTTSVINSNGTRAAGTDR